MFAAPLGLVVECCRISEGSCSRKLSVFLGSEEVPVGAVKI